MKQKIILFLLFLFSFQQNWGQTNDNLMQLLVEKKIITQREADSLAVTENFTKKVNSENKIFTVGLEFRPRGEYRDGYRQLPNDTTKAAFFASQRSRLNISYEQPWFKFHTSIQDIRVWGQYGQASTTGSLNVYEAFVEINPFENFVVKMGRQKVELDNGRLFSAANWSQTGRAHDGLNLIYKNNTIETELLTAFNQSSERIFETSYSPTTFNNYKLLNLHYLKAKINDDFTITTINSADSFESKTNSQTLYTRGTSGGRLEFKKNNFYLTFAGYYQYGQLQSGADISAYYFQPEIQYKFKKWTTRLGAEYMSGDNAAHPSTTSKSFVPLYGVAWKFMGNMDYFTTFPKDVLNGGLVNPYLFVYYNANKKLCFRSDFHLFYLQNKVFDKQGNNIKSYLGYENDLSLRYKYNSFSTIDFGFSYMFAQKSMEDLKGGDSNKTPLWSYIMITFNPELFSSKK
ncbi:alginate export family protein [Flavobacterium adhaerens]|uniref:alginate export family protein n=1 Tax=Flavobacterium adhaerens TaxID=3149043 RepID=UPI0032B49B16